MPITSRDLYIDWLKSIATNVETRKNLDLINTELDRFEHEQRQLKRDKLLELNFKYNTIWTTLRTCYGFLRVYLPIFKDNEHCKLDNFRDLNIQKPVIVDVGANEGYYSLKMQFENPSAIVYAIEPNPITYKYLKRNVSGNNPNNILIFKLGLGEDLKEQTFEYVKEISRIASSDISKLGFDWLDKSRIQQTTIKTKTLDSFCKQNNLSKINLLKIDTEGAELDILDNAHISLGFTHNLVVEYHSIDIRSKILTFMRHKNWELLYEDIDTATIGDLYFINKPLKYG